MYGAVEKRVETLTGREVIVGEHATITTPITWDCIPPFRGVQRVRACIRMLDLRLATSSRKRWTLYDAL